MDERSDAHADRRSPAAPAEPLDLHAEAGALLEQAATMAAGRAARALIPGAGAPLTQTVMALAAGRDLQDHDAPGPATLYVISGSGVLTVGDDSIELTAGHWTIIPPRTHGLHAEKDLVVLLTVAPDSATT